ncbi:Cys-tRNA(Pro) deacylase [Marinobacter sp. NFXS9]|uniref:Cys-tRNA(Pro) deacylase n=1 Tax=Marinobacter sp. NFXS9 TaxID=2818433 RepID=UPI0032DFD976
MTPAIDQARKAGIAFEIQEYDHDPNAESYGEEAVVKLGLSPDQVFKTLVVKLDSGALAVGVVPVTGKLNLKQMAKAAGAKKATMAEARDVERVTGYVLGGVSPLGQKKRLKTVVDASAESLQTVHVSAGRRGLEIALAPADLVALTGGAFAPIAQN